MNFNRIQKTVIIALVLTSYTSIQPASAQPGGQGGSRSGPPPEAFEVCADKTSGDSCTVTGRRGEELQGSCKIPPRKEETLVCAPEGAPGHGREAQDS